jgi:predicted ferric reductase
MEMIMNYANITHIFGQLSGLIGMTLFSLTFLLATRLKFIEDIFEGLDKVYLVHRVVGSAALILIMFRPIFLVLKFIPQDIALAAIYLLPGTLWSINFGIIALLLMILLIYITLYSALKYNTWKLSHRFLGIVFVFAMLHIFLVRGEASQDNIFAGYYVYTTIVSLVGGLSLIYIIFVNNLKLREVKYEVDSIDKKKDGIFSITLLPLSKPIKYKSGQFVFLRFYSQGIPKEQHPFSIASKTNSTKIRVVIKSLGDYTTQLSKLKIGSKATVEGPYGRFNKTSKSDQVWVAGGIGITPFLGMAADLNADMNYDIDLYYSVKSNDEFVSLDYLKSVEKLTNGRFKVIPWVSNDMGYLGIKGIMEKSKDAKYKEFYLCGPAALKDSIVKGAMELGVSKDRIYSEEFNFR